jgi:endonuclease/exonuclease/phosphatase family metal-dependent hydrolase
VISEVNSKVDEQEPVILAGDLNRKTDKASKNSDIVISFLEKEGFSMINSKN